MIDCGWDSSMYRIMRDIMQNDVNCRVDLIPIDIYKLNLVENITDMRMSMDGRNMYVTDISLPCFRRICKKYSLPKLQWCNKRYPFVRLWIDRLYFCNIEYPSPDGTQTEKYK